MKWSFKSLPFTTDIPAENSPCSYKNVWYNALSAFVYYLALCYLLLPIIQNTPAYIKEICTNLNLQIKKTARLISSFRGQQVEMFAPSSFCQLCRFQDVISINTHKPLLRGSKEDALFPKSCKFILKITTQLGWQARRPGGGRGAGSKGNASEQYVNVRLPASASRPDWKIKGNGWTVLVFSWLKKII